MPEINYNQAREFLENITSDDKVAVIHHDDGDGICAGVIYYDWCKRQGAKVKQFTYSIGKTKLRKFDLENFDKLIFTDLASGVIGEEISEINNKEILFADHHPKELEFNGNVSYLITTDMGYIPASRSAYEITGIRPLLGLIGTINDAGNLYSENEKFIEEKLKEFNMDFDEFKDKIANIVANSINFFSGREKEVFDFVYKSKTIEDIKSLKKYSEPIENEIEKFVNGYEEGREKLGDINFYYFEPKFHVRGAVSFIISNKYSDDKFIFASPRENEGTISISGRCQSGEIDMAEVLKAGVAGLEGANAGGHRRASGAGVKVEDLEKFKENIRNYINSRKD